MNQSFLAVVDVDRIHDYVFSPHRLKLIRGGSNILREIDCDDFRAQVTAPGTLVSSAGGTVLAIFPDRASAVDFTRSACDAVAAKAIGATATPAVAAYPGAFKDAVEAAMEALEVRKTARDVREGQVSSPFLKICEDCGLRPASMVEPDPEGAERACCAACAQRRDYSEKSPYLDEIGQLAGFELEPNISFENLASVSRPNNYLAFVYIDLDRLGRFLHEYGTASPESYRELSGAITSAIKSATLHGCAALCDPTSEDHHAPFEILLMGGDDAILMLPAQNVFPFLRVFHREFESCAGCICERFGADAGALTFSAAVVWAHHRYPIAQFRQRAEELLRSGKGRKGDSVDYAVLAGGMAKDVTEGPLRKVDSRSMRRTMKPYSLLEFLDLEDTARRWKTLEVPSSKAHALYRIACEPWEQSLLDYWALYSRLEKDQQGLWDEAFPKPGGIWTVSGSLLSTRAADLIEIWDFVEEK